MKHLSVSSILVILIAFVLAACSQTTSSPTPEPAQAAPEAATLLAEATGDEAVRRYLADHFAADDTDIYPEIDKERLHSNEFYEVLANALEVQGETQALERVEAAFSALPHAYLMGSGDVKAWDPVLDSPLVTYLLEDDEVYDTATAFDSDLSAHVLATDQEPDRVLLVLHEGVAEQAPPIETQARFVCNEANHDKLYEHRFRIIDSETKGKIGQVVRQADFERGWVLEDAYHITVKSRGGTADTSLINAGNHFITLAELKEVRDNSFDFANELGLGKEIKIKVENAIKYKYERFIKFTTDEVTERSAVIDYELDTKTRIFGHKLVVDLYMAERCNSVEATTKDGTEGAFKGEVLRVASSKTQADITFNTSPGNIQASLSVKGNGTSYSAYNGKTLTLKPGTYTVSGSGYDMSSGQYYTVTSQTITVAAGKDKTVYVSMRPQ